MPTYNPTPQGDILYWAEFSNNPNTHRYRVEIRKLSYSGSAKKIEVLAQSPLVFRHIDVEDSNIQGSEVIFRFISLKNEYAEHDLMTQGSDFEYEIRIFVDFNPKGDSNGWVFPNWMGYILPSETSRTYFDDKSVYTITATDYLSRLKNIRISNHLGIVPASRKTIQTVIGWCLAKIPLFTDYWIQNGIYETSMTGGGSKLGKAYIYPKVFTKEKNKDIVPENCYNVLDSLCKSFNASLCSPFLNNEDIGGNGYPERFWLMNYDQASGTSYQAQYNASTGETGTYQTSDLNNIIDISEFIFKRDSEFSRKIPLKSFELVQQNYDFGESFNTTDYQDLDNTGIWTRTNIASISESNGVHTVGVNSGVNGNFITTTAFALTNATKNKYVRVFFTLKNTTTYEFQTDPLYNLNENVVLIHIYIGVKVLSITTFATPCGVLALPGQTVLFASPIIPSFSVNDNFSHVVKLEVFNQASSRAKTLEISNVVINTCYGQNGQSVYNLMYDYNFLAWTESGIDPQKTVEISIGDSDLPRNGSGITLSTTETDLSKLWCRYGKSESKPLYELIMQSYFNRFGGNARQLKLKVYDPTNQTALYKRIIFDGLTFLILDYEKDFQTSWVSLRLQQISTSDVSYSYAKKHISELENSIVIGTIGGETAYYLNVNQGLIEFGTGGGAQLVYVMSNLAWLVTKSDSWITVVPASGSGDNYFDVQVPAYGSGRMGTVTVSGGGFSRVIDIWQNVV